MMKIGLVDVDGGKFPNYALMKISRYYRQQGIDVEWADPMFGNYDKVYISKIFNFSEDNGDIWNCEVERGGTGYGSPQRVAERNRQLPTRLFDIPTPRPKGGVWLHNARMPEQMQVVCCSDKRGSGKTLSRCRGDSRRGSHELNPYG